MEYKNLVRDFADRTLKNLEAIETAIKRDPDAELFEVTQLINSMLGLLVFPQQHFLKNIPKTSLEELRRVGWPVPTMQGSLPQANDLRELTRCLRNGISHFNLEFTTDGHKITGINIWNCPNRSETRIWEAHLGLRELREFARKFISLLLEADK